MTLFEECIEALGDSAVILTKQKTDELFNNLEKKVPFSYIADTVVQRVKWENVNSKYTISDVSKILPLMEMLSIDSLAIVNILWNDPTLPAINVALNDVINAIDDVTAVGFDTWIVQFEEEYIIEFYHDGEIVFGLFSR